MHLLAQNFSVHVRKKAGWALDIDCPIHHSSGPQDKTLQGVLLQGEKLFVVTAVSGPIMPSLLLPTDQSCSLALLIDQSLLQA